MRLKFSQRLVSECRFRSDRILLRVFALKHEEHATTVWLWKNWGRFAGWFQPVCRWSPSAENSSQSQQSTLLVFLLLGKSLHSSCVLLIHLPPMVLVAALFLLRPWFFQDRKGCDVMCHKPYALAVFFRFLWSTRLNLAEFGNLVNVCLRGGIQLWANVHLC